MNMQDHPEQNRARWFQSQAITWVLLGFLAVGAVFLITGRPADLLWILPFAIFLCPAMMLFTHRGHGGHTG